MNQIPRIINQINSPFTTIGIVSDRQKDAVEVLEQIKTHIHPNNFNANHKTSITLINGSKVICQKLDTNTFRGMSLNMMVIHEVKPGQKFEKFKENYIPVMASVENFKIIIL
jgi:hypothetical protein